MVNRIITIAILIVSGWPCLTAQNRNLVFTYGFGYTNITLLSEMQRDGHPDVFTGVTPEMLSGYMPDGTYPTAVNAFLVVTEDQKNILVDAGHGRELFNDLSMVRKSVEDIDVILLTHMHGDHIEGLVRDGQKSFPNADLYISQAEHDYWMNDEARNSQPENRRGGFDNAREVIRLYKDKLHLFEPGEIDSEQPELLPGIRAVAAYGHTPGHTGFMLESDDYKFFIWGDLTHATVLHLPHPEVQAIYDLDKEQAVETRKKILKYLGEQRIRAAGMHVEFPGMLDVIPNGEGGYHFELVCTCEGI